MSCQICSKLLTSCFGHIWHIQGWTAVAHSAELRYVCVISLSYWTENPTNICHLPSVGKGATGIHPWCQPLCSSHGAFSSPSSETWPPGEPRVDWGKTSGAIKLLKLKLSLIILVDCVLSIYKLALNTALNVWENYKKKTPQISIKHCLKYCLK